jgi:hypothetical protein
VRTGRGSAGDLHVHRRLALQKSVLREKLAADVGEAFWRIFAGKGDPDSLEAPPQTLIVEPGGERPSIDYAENLIHAVAENESAVLHGYSRLCSGDKGAIYVNKVFECHAM